MEKRREERLAIGKVPESVLKRSVMGALHSKRPEVVLGSSVGEDCAAIELAEDEVLVLSTDPITGTAKDIGTLAILVTINDLASAGAEGIGILLTVLLPPGSTESDLATMIRDADAACAAAHVQIVGGHTEVTAAVAAPLVSVTGVGKVKKGHLISTGGARPGMDLVATKWIAIEGTSILAKEKRSELADHFSEGFVDQAAALDRYLSVQREGMIAAAHGAAAMHDVTEGGILGALWEMAEASGVGVTVDRLAIPIRQETIELTEYFGIDPYRLISSGCMLIATVDGAGLVAKLAAEDIPASVIGRVTDGHDRILVTDDRRTYLTPPGADELYRVL